MRLVNFRVDEKTLDKIDAAACAAGQNRTEYLISCALGPGAEHRNRLYKTIRIVRKALQEALAHLPDLD
jgi:uncharacterized protein (DUF1778 family)